MLVDRRDQRFRLGLVEVLRQCAGQAGRVERPGRIIAPRAFDHEEAIELPERREAPRRGARADARFRERAKIAAQIVALGFRDIAIQKMREILEIGGIGRDSEARGTPLGREHFKKRVDARRERGIFGHYYIPADNAASTASARASLSSPTAFSPATTRANKTGSGVR